eukprot:5072237-Pyramimonas_sp.AAC.1
MDEDLAPNLSALLSELGIKSNVRCRPIAPEHNNEPRNCSYRGDPTIMPGPPGRRHHRGRQGPGDLSAPHARRTGGDHDRNCQRQRRWRRHVVKKISIKRVVVLR